MKDRILTIELTFTLRPDGDLVQIIDGDGDILACVDTDQNAIREACEFLSISRYDSGLIIDIDGRVQ